MHLRIAQLAPPFESVPPFGYGGTERVVCTLTEELVRRGHDVTLFASGDSHTSARLVPIVAEALWHRTPPCNDFSAHGHESYDTIFAQIGEYDIVHSHLYYSVFALARDSARPLVTTLHGLLA